MRKKAIAGLLLISFLVTNTVSMTTAAEPVNSDSQVQETKQDDASLPKETSDEKSVEEQKDTKDPIEDAVEGSSKATQPLKQSEETVLAQTEAPQTVNVTSGSLTVDVVFDYDVPEKNAKSMKATLKQNGQSVKSEAFTKSQGDSAASKWSAQITDILQGEYSLEVTGSNFVSYSQTLQIDNQVHKVSLVNTSEFFELRKEAGQGIITYGDVTGDGQIDDSDGQTLASKIQGDASNQAYDLNGDGTVDVLDMQILSVGMDSKSLEAKVAKKLSTEGMSVEAAADTTIEGNPEDILKESGEIVLKPANNEAITASNPVEITLDVSARTDCNVAAFTITPPKDSENKIVDGVIRVEYEENGTTQTMDIPISQLTRGIRFASTSANVTTEKDGTLVVNLGKQIAIKKIVIKVTQTESTKLADIAEVEFLNGMEDRIPEPQLNIPTGLKGQPADKKFSLSWGAQPNVTGYEVQVTYNGKTEQVRAKANSVSIASFGGTKLKNGETYECKVRSVNGEWASPYSDSVSVSPKPEKVPFPPSNIQVVGGYKQLKISWSKVEDTDWYTLYYREKGTNDYQKVDKIAGTSYTVTGLKESCTYEVCLTATNYLGASPKSQVYTGKTTDLNPPITTNYKLINVPQEGADKTAHIERVTYNASAVSEFAIVDNDYATSWRFESWDAGGYNAGKPSPIVTFDQEYELDHVIVVPDAQQQFDYGYAKTRYWSADGTEGKMIDGCFNKKTSSNGQIYYEFEFSEPIHAKQIQINFALGFANGNGHITIGEMKFYYYDSLEDDIDNLYADGMHVTLKDTVTKQTIEDLETRLNTKDEVSQEYHPKKEMLEKEIAYAKDLLADKKLEDQIQIDATVSNGRDSHLKIGAALNTWQPLGVTAHAGEELTVYAGREGAALGTSANLSLIATQYHAESGTWSKTVVSDLKVGKNAVTIPTISNMDFEKGGSLYVEYTKTNVNAKISVRVSGGTKIPVLDLANVADEAARKEKIATYVSELNEIVPKLEEEHNKSHKGKAESNCDYDYDKKNCILGATEIVLRQVSYSVSSEQILAAIEAKGGATQAGQTEALYNSLKAMDDMVKLFYQHKGYAGRTDTTAASYGDKNYLPSGRLNYRYMRMSNGAFMYAGGKHIGIEWGSIKGLGSAVAVVSNNGKYVSGNCFGWGISHEAGHVINQGSYAIAEITNNYFALLSGTKDTNSSVRFKYDDVYDKVTSGILGKSDSVFTSLAMYWQLHLAYDNAYNYKTYDTYEEQIRNLFFARVDMYDRNTSLAPSPKGIALTQAKDVDNTFMRLACAAAEKNLLDFFKAWGMQPNDDTIAYAEQFEKEARNIQYITDDAKVYRIEGGTNVAGSTTVQAAVVNESNSNQVKISLGNTAADANAMLGYEILRNGETVGFVSADKTEFIDTIPTINNRVFTYSVVGYDKLLNQTAKVTLDSLKVSTDGSVAKDKWSVTTNMTSDSDEKKKPSDDYPEQTIISGIDAIYNNDYTDEYVGDTEKPEIVINFGEELAVCGIKVKMAQEDSKIGAYEVYVSDDGQKWEKVKADTLEYIDKTATAYFNKENDSKLYTYDASYLKIKATNQIKVSLAEIDVLGPSGDNVELLEDGIGLLKTDYTLDEQSGEKIPKESLVFTGEYKGNPFYNAVKLYDQDDKIINGTSVFFAEEPKHGELGEISSGTWVFYIEPDKVSSVNITSVRAELYRVDNAETLEGERLVSDTMRIKVPEVLPEIELRSDNTK